MFECDYNQCGLVILDATGNSNLTNIKSGQLLLIQTNTIRNITTKVSYYEQCGCCTNNTAIEIIKVVVILFHIKLSLYEPISISCSSCKGQNFIVTVVKKIQPLGTVFLHQIVDITLSHCDISYNSLFGNTFQFIDCHFSNVCGTGVIVHLQARILAGYAIVQISNSGFRFIESNNL